MNLLLNLATGGAAGVFTGCCMLAVPMAFAGMGKETLMMMLIAYTALLGAAIFSALEKMNAND